MGKNCVCNFLSGLGAFMIVVLRIFLFIVCVFMFLSQIIQLWGLNLLENYIGDFTKSDEIHVGLIDYVQVICLAILALIGAHGAYTKNPRYLKIFALILSIYAVVFFLSTITIISTTDWEHEAALFTKKMKENAKEYEFDVKPTDRPNKATRAWDWLQKGLRCCGLKDYHDWEDWRSSFLSKSGRLPKSCCFGLPRAGDQECSVDSYSHFRDGCGEKVTQLLQVSVFHSMGVSLWYLLVAAVAIVVAKKHDPDHGSTGAQPAMDQQQQQYQRFQGNVYVRQPAMNEAYEQSKSMYPDAASVEKRPTPPPSYVSRA